MNSRFDPKSKGKSILQREGSGYNVYRRGNANGTSRGQAMNRGYDNKYVAPPPPLDDESDSMDDDYDEEYLVNDIYWKWNGLFEEDENDFEIVWPPMVIIVKPRLDKDDNDKWIGMGSQELLDYFEKYDPIQPVHSYGPQGHRRMSVLVFESNVSGYVKAEFLDKVLAHKGLGILDAWDLRHGLLYGFLATKEDLEVFNRHSHDETRVKFEMKSYREMVVEDVSEIYKESQQLKYYKNKNTKLKELVEELEETVGVLREKLRNTEEDNHILRLKTKLQHEQIKEEMDAQDRFLRETIKQMREDIDAKDEDFDELQEQERGEIVEQEKMKNWYEEEMCVLESEFNDSLHQLLN